MIRIEGTLANKSNTNEVRFNRQFWSSIERIVRSYQTRGQKQLWWVAPKAETQSWQEVVAWQIKAQAHRYWLKEALQVTIRLVGQNRHDIDGVKAILDALEQSGRITNDRQVKKLLIEHVPGTSPAIEMEIEAL